MTQPTIGVVIATPGRQSLAKTLASIHYQRENVEDVLVVGDGYSEPTRELVEYFATLGLPCRYQATEKTRDWGHSQINYGLQHVRGDYICYEDDDDIKLPRSFEEMSRLIAQFDEPMPLIGRVKTPQLGLLWQTPGPQAVLDGHCLVAPNNKKKLGWMSSEHHGDQCYLHTTLRHYPRWQWTDRIWTLTRPEWVMEVFEQYRTRSGSAWAWKFLNHEGTPRAVMTLRKDPDHDRMFATIGCNDDLSSNEYIQLVQWAVFACQGNDCWFTSASGIKDPLLIDALLTCNFKEHTPNEYTHDWPPDFWPALPYFDAVIVKGEKMLDYRDDVWAGKATT